MSEFPRSRTGNRSGKSERSCSRTVAIPATTTCAGSVASAATMLALLFLVAFAGCETKQKTASVNESNSPHARVAVTNYPLYCVVSSICIDSNGPVKEVVYVGPPNGSDAHSWMPAAKQIRDLQKVDLIICNGPGAVFANWMDKVTIDESKLCKTTDAIKLTEFVVVKDYQLVHSHGPEGEHSHSWVVPQSWLSPRIARNQAKLCFDRLVSKYGESTQLDNGFAELQKQFDKLEAAVEKIKTANPELIVASSTPDVQYLTREFDWTDRYLQWTDSRDIDQAEKELADMRARVAKANPDAPQSEKLFVWSGNRLKQLDAFADSQWPATTTIDLIDTPSESLSIDGYFQRMSTNLQRIGDSLE